MRKGDVILGVDRSKIVGDSEAVSRLVDYIRHGKHLCLALS